MTINNVKQDIISNRRVISVLDFWTTQLLKYMECSPPFFSVGCKYAFKGENKTFLKQMYYKFKIVHDIFSELCII